MLWLWLTRTNFRRCYGGSERIRGNYHQYYKNTRGIRPLLKGYKGKVCTIDARTISIETMEIFPQHPMLGAVVKVMG